MTQDQPKQPESETPTPETSPETSGWEQTVTPDSTSAGETSSASGKPSQTKVGQTAKKPSFVDSLLLFCLKIPVWWKAALTKFRQLFPESFRQKLPNDAVLTGAIALVLFLIFSLNSALSSGKPPSVVVAPEDSTPTEVAVTPTENQVSSGIIAPGELTAPKLPEVVETLPPPPPVLTPEESLILGIQNQVATIAGDYGQGLILSIQANFPESLLIVKVANDWYTFDAAKQDQIVADMWQRSQELDFSKIEISDNQGRSIARSPVIGSKMIILQRQLSGIS